MNIGPTLPFHDLCVLFALLMETTFILHIMVLTICAIIKIDCAIIKRGYAIITRWCVIIKRYYDNKRHSIVTIVNPCDNRGA